MLTFSIKQQCNRFYNVPDVHYNDAIWCQFSARLVKDLWCHSLAVGKLTTLCSLFGYIFTITQKNNTHWSDKNTHNFDTIDSMRWFSQSHIALRHIFEGCTPRGLWPPNKNSAEKFVQCTYPNFHRPVFTRSEVIVLINKQTSKQTHTQINTQTDAAENIQRSSLRYDVG